jgi:hypothetical protein
MMKDDFMIRTAIAFVALAASATAAEESFQVFPERVTLSGARDFQSMIVQHTADDGTTTDLSDRAEFRVSDAAIAQVDGRRLLPIGDGDTTLQVQVNGQALTVPVSVEKATEDLPLSFRLDVMPVFTKAGCNSGRCHGAARGKDGFQLSLYGFDPAGDHFRLTREISGRRINLARPEASLLLTKAIGQAPHTGGERFTSDSPSYAILHRWLVEGAADDAAEIAVPEGIEIYPREAVLPAPELTQNLVVRARYSDGTTRDVTHLAAFLSNNDNTASVSEDGVVTAGARGEAFVMARFATFTEGIPVIALPPDSRPAPDSIAENNYIDKLVNAKLRKLRITPSELCSDEQFLRRASIDLVGITPSHEQYYAFLADDPPDKRAALVDEMLGSEHFVNLWAMKFGELLKIRTSNQVSHKALLGFHNWVRDRIAADMPLHEMLAEVIAAEGGTFDNPATNYYQIEANNRQLAENVAQSMFGMRIQCAQCHNHPFDRWTMDDYYGFTAFFSRIGFKQSSDPREFIVYGKDSGEVHHLVDDRVVAPRFLGGSAPELGQSDRRQVLADWIASKDNPYAARNLANVIWAHHFGRGIIEPVDDVRISNPASNERLLSELADRLREYDFSLRSLVRDICLSRTYQLSTRVNETNADDFTNFSHAAVRRIRAEVLLDSISQITGTTDRFARLPAGARSVEIADGALTNYFLSTFGRAPRETVCSCEVDVVPNLSQAFHLLNGETTNEKILEGAVVASMLAEGKSHPEILNHLYIACLGRLPHAAEVQELLQVIKQGDDEQQELNDIFWALLNSREFIFNH